MRPEDQRTPQPHYAVIPRTLIFLTRGTQVLLLRGAPDKRLWANQYNGIGGHMEPGESPLQCAQRELAEETGLEDVPLTLRGVIHVTLPTPPGVLLFVFTGTCQTGQESRASEEGTAVWVELADLPKLPLVEDLPVLLPRILDPNAPLQYGRYIVTDTGLQITFDEPTWPGGPHPPRA